MGFEVWGFVGSGFGIWGLGLGLRVRGFVCQFSGFRFQVSDFELHGVFLASKEPRGAALDAARG